MEVGWFKGNWQTGQEAPENWLIHNQGNQPLNSSVSETSRLTWALVILSRAFQLYPGRLLPQRFLNGRGFPVDISVSIWKGSPNSKIWRPKVNLFILNIHCNLGWERNAICIIVSIESVWIELDKKDVCFFHRYSPLPTFSQAVPLLSQGMLELWILKRTVPVF